MRDLRLRRTARREIDEAFAWYQEQSPDAARAFLAALDEGMARIQRAPEQQPLVRGRLRRVLLRRFPYAIYYKVFPTVVSVVGVIQADGIPAPGFGERDVAAAEKMTTRDSGMLAHQRWIGLIQPVGLVVSSAALVTS